MNTNLQILAQFIANNYLPKQNKVVSGKEILQALNSRLPQINEKLNISIKKDIKETQLREMVNYIRSNNLCKRGEICSNKQGYYISQTKEEVLAQIESMERRIAGMTNAIRGMRKNLSKYKDDVEIKVEHQKVYKSEPVYKCEKHDPIWEMFDEK